MDAVTGIPQDPFFYPWFDNGPLQHGGKNKGITQALFPPLEIENLKADPDILQRSVFQQVSPFLIGRRYVNNPPTGTSNQWEDDEPDNSNAHPGNYEELDSGMIGLFYVNDPSNDAQFDFPIISNQKWGFNDLLRRRNDLCDFVNNDCAGPGPDLVVKLVALVRFVPLPEASH